MFDLSKKALERLKGGGKSAKAPADSVSPFKEAMREAFEAVKADDFEAFNTAFESAIEIRLADDGSEDELEDAEPYELDEIE